MSQSDALLNFFNGMVTGWSQVFVMQPFEIIKVRLQTQSKTNPVYSGIVDCLKQIVKNQGPLALYKGTVTPLIGVGIMGSARFGIFENIKKQLAMYHGKDGQPATLHLYDKFIAAFITGLAVSFLCPIEHTRIRIQIQRGQADKIYSGSLDAGAKILKNHGIRGLFRGQGPTTIRESTGLSLYFTVIQKLTKQLTPIGATKQTTPIYVPLLAGGIGGTTYWMFNYPFDYVKTLMQSDKFGQFKYRSMAACFKQQYATGGWRAFFKGYLICMMRSFPVNAAAITVYRFMQKVTNVGVH